MSLMHLLQCNKLPSKTIMQKIAEINHLSVAFQQPEKCITAVDEVGFELFTGETLALLGESGCGKSLTSLAMMRLLPVNGVYGQASEVNCAGEELLQLPEKLMRGLRGKRIAMIFQEPMTALNPVLTIGEQVAEALRQHQTLSAGAIRARSIALLQEVEMPHAQERLKQYPHQLSGGQKQRVVIAMALANNPQILIASKILKVPTASACAVYSGDSNDTPTWLCAAKL